jgi:hypothetical protein
MESEEGAQVTPAARYSVQASFAHPGSDKLIVGVGKSTSVCSAGLGP